MERRFENDLKDLKLQILAMGGFVEQAIEKATQALNDREPKKLAEVHTLEQKINESHINIDERCLMILARQAPLAADLRLILAVIKINTDLERMGDQAVNISHNAEHYLNGDPVNLNVNFPKMAQIVKAMVRDSLDAFMKEDTPLAEQVLTRDDEVDDFKDNIFKVLIPYMQLHSDTIEAALNLILIARNLERMADHATNIAEDVIFAYTGEDVRHGISQSV